MNEEVLNAMGPDRAQQAQHMVHHMLARGTTHIHSHVEGVAATREACADLLTIQIAAFPQTGMMMAPGVGELMEDAVRQGADAVEGIDHVGIERYPKGQLDIVFAIADRYGCEINIHLHALGDMGTLTIEMMAERLKALADLLLEHDIVVVTCGAGRYPIPPILALRKAGVRMAAGSDGVRDT